MGVKNPEDFSAQCPLKDLAHDTEEGQRRSLLSSKKSRDQNTSALTAAKLPSKGLLPVSGSAVNAILNLRVKLTPLKKEVQKCITNVFNAEEKLTGKSMLRLSLDALTAAAKCCLKNVKL